MQRESLSAVTVLLLSVTLWVYSEEPSRPARGEAATRPTATQPIDPDNPPAGVFVDEWYAVLLNGRKCGQMRVVMERVRGKKGQPDTIRAQTRMKLSVKREAATISLSVHQKSTETLDGRPLDFWRALYLSQQPLITKGRIVDGKVSITTSQFGRDGPTRTYDLPEGAMMDWAVYREQRKRGFTPGSRYDLPLYEPSIAPDRLCHTTVEIIGPEDIDLFGRQVRAIRTVQTMKIPARLGAGSDQKTTTWVTEHGDVVRMEMSVMDIPVEILSCPRSVATAENDPAELMVSMLVPLNRPLKSSAESITYRIRVKDPGPDRRLPPFPETGIQRVLHHNDTEAVVRITRGGAADRSGASSAGELTPAEREMYLAATASVNHEDPLIRTMAEEAVGREEDPRTVARKLTRYVHGKLVRKDLSVGFATASEVARSLAGDCTEHGILLAALGRARGIPTRMVTGLVYAPFFGGKQHVLVGHLWTQFHIDGEWIDCDAAYDQVDVDPTHIAIGFTAGEDSSLADLVTSTWLNMARLEIEVIEVRGG